MANQIAHFNIFTDDTDRAIRFYSRVFGWTFTRWGPAGFHTTTAGGGVPGSLHRRPEPVTGSGARGFECTIGVEDLDAIEAAVLANGGRLIMGKVTIPGVGDMIRFHDTEGNSVCAMKYVRNDSPV